MKHAISVFHSFNFKYQISNIEIHSQIVFLFPGLNIIDEFSKASVYAGSSTVPASVRRSYPMVGFHLH